MVNETEIAIDPLEVATFNSAANGDATALATLAFAARQNRDATDFSEAESNAVAEAFARLAVVHGNPADMLFLADVLIERAYRFAPVDPSRQIDEALEWQRAARKAGHPAAAMHLATTLTILADSGNELAAVELNRLMDDLGPDDGPAVTRAIADALAELA